MNRLTYLLLFLPLLSFAQSVSEEAAVKACIQQMFDAMRAGDSTMLRPVFHPEARMQTVFTDREGKPQIRQGTVDGFVQQIGAPHEQVYDERIRLYDIKIDGLLATAWTEYAFYLGDQLRHCGVNAFQLFKTAEGWRITQITDTRNREDCEEIPAELATTRMNYEHPIPFVPEEYVCYRTSGAITLDGKLDEASWQSAPWTNDFVDIQGERKPKPTFRTRAKMLWDDQYFYFGAILEEPHVWAKLKQRDTIIFLDDDFEIFIDPDGDGYNYYEFEMNARNTVWDLLMLWPYHLSRGPNYVFNWNNPGLKTAAYIKGTLNNPTDVDEYWSVEIAFPWSALQELAAKKVKPAPGDQWRLNFSRVDWHMDVVEGQYVKQKDPQTGKQKREENWVWSPTGRIDMHRPETWGFVQFSDKSVGKESDKFQTNPEEKIKWALWQLFYQQRQFKEKYGRYTAESTHFSLPQVELGDYIFTPRFHASKERFQITAPALGEGRWHIGEGGRIWRD